MTVLGRVTAALPDDDLPGDPGHGDPDRGAATPLRGDVGRVVAYLAVHRGPQRRAAVAADLWPGFPAVDAAAQLDEALAVPVAAALVGAAGGPDGTIALDPAVDVDLDEAMALVRELAAAPGAPQSVPADLPAATALLGADLLPGEAAPWLAVERERFRQIRLNALEELSAALSAGGRHGEAVALAEEIVRTAPSRESARRALIEAHLAQGEIAEAVAQYDDYQELLRSSVGGPTTGWAASGHEAFGLDGLLPPEPAWPVLRVNRSMQRVGMPPPGGVTRPLRGASTARTAPRRLVSGGSVPGTTR